MTHFRLPGVVVLLFSLSVAPAWGQHDAIQGYTAPDDHSELEQEMQRNLQRQQQKKRYLDMKRDSQKLLELATELKQYVDRSGENVLSLDVVRKAEELEKLARRVKENMRAD